MRVLRILSVALLTSLLFLGLVPAQATTQNLYIYLVRHGQSVDNASGLQSGWSATPLTALGQRQAAAIGLKLTAIDFAATYSSGSVRAAQTLTAILAARTGSLSAQVAPEFREWGVGSFDQKPGSVIQAAEAKILKTKAANVWKFTDEQRFNALAKADPTKKTENWLQFKNRILLGVSKVKASNKSGQVLVVSHGYVIKHLIKLLTGSYTSLPISNTAVTVLQFANGRWVLKQGPSLTPKVFGTPSNQ